MESAEIKKSELYGQILCSLKTRQLTFRIPSIWYFWDKFFLQFTYKFWNKI